MATGVTVFGSDLTMKQWSEATILEMEKYSTIDKFIGEGPNNVIQRRTDLNAKKGQTLEFDLLKKLTGDPVINEEELTGNEEKMEFVTDTVKIAEMAFAVKKYGKFEDIKSKKNLLSLAKGELSLHMRETYDSYIVRLLSGDTTLDSGDGAWTGTAPSTNRKLYGGNWDGASGIDTGDDWLRVRDLSRAKQYARVTCGIRPVMVEGVETYVVIMHPYVWGMIRAKDPDYENALLYAEQRGKENPMWSGIHGWWDGMAIYLNDHCITNATYSTAYRSLFLGAQAGILAWGEGPYAGEQDYDYGRKKGVSISMLWGFAKSVLGPDDFQSPSTYTDDYGVVTIDSYAAALSGTASDTEL
jgi:N4-gp56 family major capsid protein